MYKSVFSATLIERALAGIVVPSASLGETTRLLTEDVFFPDALISDPILEDFSERVTQLSAPALGADSEGDDIEYILTLGEEATISQVQLFFFPYFSELETTTLLKVGDETCHEFPGDFAFQGYVFIDCSSNTASDTVTLSGTTANSSDNIVVAGVILETGEASSQITYWFDGGNNMSPFSYATDCTTQNGMAYYEVTLEESDNSGEYNLSHYCHDDEEDHYLRQDELAEDIYSADYLAEFASSASELPVLSLAMTPYPGAPEGYYSHEYSSGGQGKVTLFYFGPYQDYDNEIYPLGDSQYHEALGCFERDADYYDKVTYISYALSGDTQDGCMRHTQLLGYDYAVLYDGECYGINDEEWVSSLTAADDAAAYCDTRCFKDEQESGLTCGGYAHFEIFQYVAPPPPSEDEEEEEEEETSASYLVGVASALLASAVSLA